MCPFFHHSRNGAFNAVGDNNRSAVKASNKITSRNPHFGLAVASNGGTVI